jgi:hypothetical protein
MKLSVPFVNGGSSPTPGLPFNVVVQALDCASAVRNVTLATNVSLSLANGVGTLGGPSSCTIPAGSSSCIVVGVTYSVTDTGVVLAATRTAGDNLGPGNSAPFIVTSVTAVSRKVHGSAVFDMPLDATGNNPN